MTLMEVVLALGLLAGLLITVALLFLHLLAGSKKSTDMSAGTMAAERILQEECASKGFLSSAEHPLFLYNSDGSAAQEFVYQVTCTPVALKLYYVDVRVTWEGGQRQGVGKLSTRLGRLAGP